MYDYNCILVVGPGRCGTSTVAQMLHVNFNIPMTEFTLFDDNNPDGYWEDVWFEDVAQKALEKGAYVFQRGFLPLIEKRLEQHPIWGLKAPHVSMYLDQILPYVRALVIRCDRDLRSMARSQVKTTGWSIREAVHFSRRVNRLIDSALTDEPVLNLDFTDRIPKHELRKQIDSFLRQHLGGIPERKYPPPLFVDGYETNYENGTVALQLWHADGELEKTWGRLGLKYETSGSLVFQD